MKELSLTISSQNDANKLYSFLTNNKHKIIKLDLKYSPKKIQASNYVDKTRGVDFTSVYEQAKVPGIEAWSRTGAVVTYSVRDGDDLNLYDVYTKELLKKVKGDDQEYLSISESISSEDCTKLGDDCRINKGFAIDGIWYCHISDIYCHQENVMKFGSEYNVPPAQRSLYYLPDYPYLSTVVLSSNLSGYLTYRYRNSRDKDISFDESVLFGEKLTFLSNHYKATYKDGVVNIDRGSIGFITDGTDNQLEPLVLIGELNEEAENVKSLKVQKSFNNDGSLINVFKTQINAFDSTKNDDWGNFKSLLTTLFKTENNKLLMSHNCAETIAGKFFTNKDSGTELQSVFCEGFETGNIGYANIMYNHSYDQSFSIEIPYSTQNNTLYTWKSDSLKNRYPNGEGIDKTDFVFKDNNEKISLNGIFYVYGENETSEELDNYMPYSFCGYEILLIPEIRAEGVADTPYKPCKVQKIIKLKPLSSVDLEKRNY